MSLRIPTDFDHELAARRVREGFHGQAFMGFIGAILEHVGPGECVISVPFADGLTQQHGLFHGGVTATLADNAAGFASFSLMSPDEQPLSVEFKINLLDKALGERLIARGRVIRNGRRLKHAAADVFAVTNGTERLVASALATISSTRSVPEPSLGDEE
ncbi:MAG: PaaI family thioesterase [Gemmatimonadota bacterium]